MNQAEHNSFEPGAAAKMKVGADTLWDRDEAIALCKAVEPFCPAAGCHVALTGGLLYKGGARKDADLLFYRIRQTPTIDTKKLFIALKELGLIVLADHGWCVKCQYNGKLVDCFFPERAKSDTQGTDYL